MSISYPLTIPSYTGFRSVDLRMVNAVAVSRSPFTLSTQAHKYAGQMWQADIALRRADERAPRPRRRRPRRFR